MSKVYLAARYSRHPEMRGYRDELEAMGHKVTARWIDCHTDVVGDFTASFTQEFLNENPEKCEPLGQHDINDLDAADWVISFTGGGLKGGRHVEFGYAVATGKRLMVVGPRENVSHTLASVEHFEDWPAARAVLVESTVEPERADRPGDQPTELDHLTDAVWDALEDATNRATEPYTYEHVKAALAAVMPKLERLRADLGAARGREYDALRSLAQANAKAAEYCRLYQSATDEAAEPPAPRVWRDPLGEEWIERPDGFLEQGNTLIARTKVEQQLFGPLTEVLPDVPSSDPEPAVSDWERQQREAWNEPGYEEKHRDCPTAGGVCIEHHGGDPVAIA